MKIILLFLFLLFTSAHIQAQELIPLFQHRIANGNQIIMLDSLNGFASACGGGFETAGGFYQYKNGKWKVSMAFPYSDSPILKVFSPTSVFGLHHLVHYDNWKYVFYHFNGENWNRIDIPLIKWDEVDYTIIKSMDGFSENDIWLVGQKAAILHYKNKSWVPVHSPVIWKDGDGDFDKDFNVVKAVGPDRVYVAGRNGIFIRFEGSDGRLIPLPLKTSIISMDADEGGTVFLATDQGEVAVYDGKFAKLIPTPFPGQRINSIRKTKSGSLFITQNSTVFRLQPDESWKPVLDANQLKAGLNAVSEIPGSPADKLIFLTSDGIYSSSKRGKVSFRESSAEANITATSRGALFFDADGDFAPDLLLTGEMGQPDLLMKNNGAGIFSDVTFESGLLKSSNGSLTAVSGDIDNDGDQDLITVRTDNHQLNVWRNTGKAKFTDVTSWSGLDSYTPVFSQIYWGHSLQFVDIDRDGDADLLKSDWDNGLIIFLNNGIGKFTRSALPDYSFLNSQKEHRLMSTNFILRSDGKWNQLITSAVSGSWVGVLDPKTLTFTTLKSYPKLLTTASVVFQNPDKTDPLIFLPDRNISDRFGRISGDSLIIFTQPVQLPSSPVYPGFPNGFNSAADVNLDGKPDLFISNHLLISDSLGFDDSRETNGLSPEGNIFTADYNRDGAPDVLITQGSEFGRKSTRLFANLVTGEKYIQVRPEGSLSGTDGEGCLIEVYPSGTTPGNALSRTTVGFTGSAAATSLPLPVTLSTGGHETVSVRLVFSSGSERWFTDVSAGSLLIATEFSEPIHSAWLFYRSLTKLVRYFVWWEELLKLGFHLSLIFGVYYALKSRDLKSIYIWPVWWIGFSLIYLVVFYFTVQFDLLINWLIPTFSGLSFASAGIGLSFAWKRYIRTNYIGQYRIERLIGEGSSGKVFQVFSPSDKKMLALKLYHTRSFDTAEGVIRFQREVAAGSQLEHPNIVKIYGQGATGSSRYLTMDYVDGENLRDYLTREISVHQIVLWLKTLADAIQYMHDSGIFHRDLKTENIMVTKSGEVKIMDLGLAKTNVFATMTRLGTSVGTLAYMSPQQAVGMPIDASSDVYSLGVIGFELLSGGTLPVSGDNDMAFVYNIFNQKPEPVSVYNDQVDDLLESIIMKSIAKQPEERFGSAKEFGEELKRWQERRKV
ncbi:MAG: protein kinase [Bacteroidetes bacterium]|nr:protein kinase [Bacteroidota bacterium]